MGKILKAKHFLASLVLLTGITACGNECTESVVSNVITDFVYPSGTRPSLSAYILDLNVDTFLFVSKTDLKAVPLLLNPDTTFTRLRLEFNLTDTIVSDTVTFYHQNSPFFVSMDCGCSMFYTLENVVHTNNIITEIEINNPSITNEKKPNIKINL